MDPDDIIVGDGNSTHKATGKELFEHYGLMRCQGERCEKEYVFGEQLVYTDEVSYDDREDHVCAEVWTTATTSTASVCDSLDGSQ